MLEKQRDFARVFIYHEEHFFFVFIQCIFDFTFDIIRHFDVEKDIQFF